tara:strand:- start:80 stop:454 length:375 start_codon:yes stop_codon:yes gene_type:complete
MSKKVFCNCLVGECSGATRKHEFCVDFIVRQNNFNKNIAHNYARLIAAFHNVTAIFMSGTEDSVFEDLTIKHFGGIEEFKAVDRALMDIEKSKEIAQSGFPEGVPELLKRLETLIQKLPKYNVT